MKVLSRMNTTFRSSTIRNGPTGGRATSSTSAAAKVRSEASAFSQAVVRSSGSTASSAAAMPGIARMASTAREPGSLICRTSLGGKEQGSWLLPAVLVQEMDVDRLEALADAEEEDADHDQRHEDREGDADLDHQRHALGAGRGEDQAVLDRHEADHLAHGIAARDHHQEAEQDHRQREGEVLARERPGLRGHRQHHHDRERDQADAGEHGLADAYHRLDLAVD